jgi:hypothetical protein
LHDDRRVRFALACCSLAPALVACGRLDFGLLPAVTTGDATAGDATARDATAPSDAAAGDATAGDATAPGDALALCDPATPFGAPTPITELNVAGAYDSTITLTADELTAYFYSDRTGGDYNIYVATRPDLATPFTVTPLAAVNSAATDKEPGATADGGALALVSDRVGSNYDIYISTPVGATPVAVANLNSSATELHPFFQLGSNDVYFGSARNGHFSIFHSAYLGSGAFANPTQVTSLDVAGYDTDDAIVMAGGLVMYFRSTRPGGLGADDIWRTSRATSAGAWGSAVDEAELDSAVLDTPSWISPDGCRLYMSSSRTDVSDLYVATRAP